MKKLLQNSVLISTAMIVVGCGLLGSRDKQTNLVPSSLGLQECSAKMLKTNRSFICTEKQKKYNLIQVNIKFTSNGFTLNQQAKKVLDKFSTYLKASNITKFTIRGYSSKTNSKLISNIKLLTQHNIELSETRAVTVREYLADKGIESSDIVIQGLGYQDPIAPNDSGANRDLNQRVEITLKTLAVKQIDNTEDQFEHINIERYVKFFSDVYLLNKNKLQQTSKIYASEEKRPMLNVNSKIFVNKKYTINSYGNYFSIISKPESMPIPSDDRKVYKLGTARYDRTYKNITVMSISDLSREASIGDFTIPNDVISEELPKQSFKIEDKIIANVIGNAVGTNSFSFGYDSIILDKGRSDGLKLGAEIILYEPERRLDGYPIPPKHIADGFVYRQSDDYAIVLIVNSVKEVTNKTMATTALIDGC